MVDQQTRGICISRQSGEVKRKKANLWSTKRIVGVSIDWGGG